MDKKELIKLIYLYLFSAIGLILVLVGLIKLVDLGLKVFIFKQADFYYVGFKPRPIGLEIPEEEWQRQWEEQFRAEEASRKADRHKTASNSISMIIVGLPLFLYHWKILKKSYN